MAIVAIAFPLYMFLPAISGSPDDWEFIVNRDGGSFRDLMRPHNVHWSTLPILVYRGLFKIFGLNTYRPYMALSVATHLTIAVLLRVVIRRAGVHPWLATAAAGGFALFGTAYGDIVWGFQIGFAGPLMFGLAQLLLVDHDGPVDRRDALALVFGAAGLMCPGNGSRWSRSSGWRSSSAAGYVPHSSRSLRSQCCSCRGGRCTGERTHPPASAPRLGSSCGSSQGAFEPPWSSSRSTPS